MMKKAVVIWFLLLAVVLTLSPAALADPGLSNFEKVNTYSNGMFSDVSSSAWYAKNVGAAFEYGLMKGNSASTFNPDGNLTIAESLALAARLHSIYNGGDGIFQQGSPWYQVYVDYALDNGLISPGQFDSYTATATRREFAFVLGKTFPSSAFPAINSITSIPDVPKSASYFDTLLMLYNAGILTGSNDYGTFLPESNIRRSEVATIVTRMADESLRRRFTPADANGCWQAYYDYLQDKQSQGTAQYANLIDFDADGIPELVFMDRWNEYIFSWDGYRMYQLTDKIRSAWSNTPSNYTITNARDGKHYVLYCANSESVTNATWSSFHLYYSKVGTKWRLVTQFALTNHYRWYVSINNHSEVLWQGCKIIKYDDNEREISDQTVSREYWDQQEELIRPGCSDYFAHEDEMNISKLPDYSLYYVMNQIAAHL